MDEKTNFHTIKMIRIAFFDFSRTIAKGTGFGSGPIFMGRKEEYESLYKKYKSNELNEEEFIKAVAELWNGFKEKDLSKIYSKIELNPNVEATLSFLKKKGIKMALVSNIPLRLAELYRNLGLDYVFGTDCEVKNGVFTGKVLRLNSDKGIVVKNLCREISIPLNESIAVGDSIGDIPMFKAVGCNNSISYNAASEVNNYAKYNIKDFKEIITIIKK